MLVVLFALKLQSGCYLQNAYAQSVLPSNTSTIPPTSLSHTHTHTPPTPTLTHQPKADHSTHLMLLQNAGRCGREHPLQLPAARIVADQGGAAAATGNQPGRGLLLLVLLTTPHCCVGRHEHQPVGREGGGRGVQEHEQTGEHECECEMCCKGQGEHMCSTGIGMSLR